MEILALHLVLSRSAAAAAADTRDQLKAEVMEHRAAAQDIQEAVVQVHRVKEITVLA
jgi:hypothetical protein